MKNASDSFTNINDTLMMNGQQVLVQTTAGIFYGTLEKADTRNSTALISNAYMLPRNGYTSQYQKPFIEETYFTNMAQFDSLPLPTITELAADGIYMLVADDLFVDTSSLSSIKLVSLTNVLVIVPVADPDSFDYPEFQCLPGAERFVIDEDNNTIFTETARDESADIGQRPPFNFDMVDIPRGVKLIFEPANLVVTVAGKREIEYGGQRYKLSPFVEKFMPNDQKNASGAYQGPKYFSYNGKILDDLRKEKELTTKIKDELVVGHRYTNSDIVRIFRCAGQGGMRRSSRTNSLVLISKHDGDNPYKDEWNSDGTILYTGMGRSGDQSIDRAQNKTLAESRTNGVELYLFESFDSNDYIYHGRVSLAGDPYYEQENDIDGRRRRVVKFPIKIVDIN
jgi:5-methylcytosine-specific restriction protein A